MLYFLWSNLCQLISYIHGLSCICYNGVSYVSFYLSNILKVSDSRVMLNFQVQWYRHKFIINSKTDWALVNRIPRLLRDIYCSPGYSPDYETMISMVQINPTMSRTPSQIRSKSRMVLSRDSNHDIILCYSWCQLLVC